VLHIQSYFEFFCGQDVTLPWPLVPRYQLLCPSCDYGELKNLVFPRAGTSRDSLGHRLVQSQRSFGETCQLNPVLICAGNRTVSFCPSASTTTAAASLTPIDFSPIAGCPIEQAEIPAHNTMAEIAFKLLMPSHWNEELLTDATELFPNRICMSVRLASSMKNLVIFSITDHDKTRRVL
jgi:hypothetical protein